MKKIIWATAVAGLASTAQATEHLETLIVTATRTQQTVDASLAPVTVIDREEIERKQSRDLLQLLATTPSLDLTRNGGAGSASSLFLRGNASDHTLVLVDGQRISSATLGTANLQFIQPENIERIEIVRGPRSSLYGSEAIGGVLQIFTRKPEKGIRPLIKVGYGNHDTTETVIGISAGHDESYISANLSHFDTQGIDNLKDDQGVNADDDAYRNTSGNLRAGTRVGGVNVELSYYRTDAENEFDDTFVHPLFAPTASAFFSDTTIETGNLRLSGNVTDNWFSVLQGGYSKDDSFTDDELGVDAFSPSEFITRRKSALWQNDLTMPNEDILTVGFDYYVDRIDSTTVFPEDSRYNRAAFVQYQGEWGRHDLVVGARHEDNEQFGTEETYNISYGIDIGAGYRLIASYGTAFKAPTFNELYFPGFGNPDFEPETSKNAEAEIRYDSDRGGWSLAYFQNEVDDLIQFSMATFQAEQIGEASIDGVEATGYTKIMGWNINANFTWLDPVDEETDDILPRRARRTASLNVDRRFDRFNVGATVLAQSERYDDAANTEKVGGYGIVNVYTGYRISEALTARLSVKNLFDKDYELVEGFNTEGTTGMVTLTYAPQL